MTTTTYNRALTVPGPQPSPIIGRTANILRFYNDSIGYTRQLFQTYGPLVALTHGGGTNIYSPLSSCPGTVFAYGPDLVRQVATQHEIYYKYPLSGKFYRKRDDSSRTQPLRHFAVGLFGVNTDQHRLHRQLMMPAFHRQRIETYRDDMVAIAQSVLDQLKVGEVCNIGEVMRHLTMRVAIKTLFGFDVDDPSSQIGRLMQNALSVQATLLTALLPLDLPGFPYRRYLDLVTQIDQEVRAVIVRKREKGIDEGDVLSMLIQARDAETGLELSEDELLGHASVIFFAGHETSSNALTWTLFLLSQHPEITADVVDELESVLHGNAPTIEQLQKLPLLERVIKESMRLIPPAPWNGRVTAQPTELGGYPIPQGTEVFVSIYQTHHMPELYPEPERFNPQRWEGFEPTAFEYNPFSAGPRLCIGAGFAMMEMKIVLAMLLQRYRLQFIPQVKVDRTGIIVMAPKYGIPMMLHPQDRQFSQGVGGVQGNVREMVQLGEN